MKKIKYYHLKYLEAEAKISSKLSDSDLEDIALDDLIGLSFCAMDIQSYAFSFQREVLKFATRRFSEDPWSWYHYSNFLRYNTTFVGEAYRAAKQSILLQEQQNEYVGAISRNFIALAFEKEEFSLVDREIERLFRNPFSQSKILFGIADDIYKHVNRDNLSDSTMDILRKFIKKTYD